MNKHKIDLFKAILVLNQETLHSFLWDFLSDYYSAEELVQSPGKYIYAKGNVDVGVVAHLDTVHKKQPQENEIYCDSEKGVMWSPAGIGGDDRCGVFIIMNLLFYGYKPCILFTWDEEIGGLGSRAVSKDIFPELNFIMQFDRKGSGQSVYYYLESKPFEQYINSFGFTTHLGTYTDICQLCPEWQCAGVNLSAGYENEHQYSEIILLNVLNDTLEKASRILEDQLKNPQYFEYIETKPQPQLVTAVANSRYSYDYYDLDPSSSEMCVQCGGRISWYILSEDKLCEFCEAVAL